MTQEQQQFFIDLKNRSEVTPNGVVREVRTTDRFCFMLNSFAMGDVIAAAPVVKYMIENFYTDPSSYLVVGKMAFREFFHFVPDSNYLDFDKRDNFWGIPPNFAVGALNKKVEPRLVRTTPKSMHLSDYASLIFADRLIPHEHLSYVPLDTSEVDLSKFKGINFYESVILVSSYRDATRSWRNESILATAKWIKDQGLIPIFVGKTDMDQNLSEAHKPKNSLPDDLSEFGVDLRNKTSIAELACIFERALAVCGVDSGPIHLAGTTNIPIVCGYTSVSPEHRIPIRKDGNTYALTANIECIGCESRWRSNFWNFENCYYGHANCSKLLTADRFINVLKEIL